MALPDPVIFLPGILGTNLRDLYSIPPELVWAYPDSMLAPWRNEQNFERVALHPDNPQYEAREPARVSPDYMPGAVYAEFIDELRHNLRRSEQEPVPVYPFGYDWRQKLDITQAQLGEFITEVIERTLLLRHYHADGYHKRRTVSLIGHSMGGLVIAGYLASRMPANGGKGDARVSKVITLATPFRGSIESVVKITTGTDNLGGTPPKPREREAARITPALYHLLPSFSDGIGLPPNSDSLFKETVWQRSIKDTIAAYIDKYRVDPAAAKPDDAAILLQRFLSEAKRYIDKVAALDLAAINLKSTDWLCIIGGGSNTRVALNIDGKGRTGPEFRFNEKEDWANDWPNSLRSGDGTVPLAGALPRFLAPNQVVCVTPDDFGAWEIADQALNKLAGFHALLPNMNLTQRLAVRFLRPESRSDIWGRPLPGVKQWDPPIAGLPPRDN
ncbi:lipase family alpha/beta hydrolase [Ferrovibrio sp.]|uniref:lipase family alpha/beta hydrolase n=1 Tax=Ferrovibrio sp. TaxID=1917215 RepID=UPI003D1327CE